MEKNKIKYCYGCLSTDRLLFPINNYFDIYIKLMENEFKNTNNSVSDPIVTVLYI